MSSDLNEKTIASVSKDAEQATIALRSAASTIVALRTALQDQNAANGLLQAAMIEKNETIEKLLDQHAVLVEHIETASSLLREPTELVFGRGQVGVSIGSIDGKALILMEPLDSPVAPLSDLGRRKAGSIKPGSVSLVIEGQTGLDALKLAVERVTLELAVAPSPPAVPAYNPTAHRIGEKPIAVYEDGV